MWMVDEEVMERETGLMDELRIARTLHLVEHWNQFGIASHF